MRPIPAPRLGDTHGLLRAINKRERLRLDEFITEFSLEELFPPGLENALGRTRQFVSYARSAGLLKEDNGTVELTDVGKRYVRSEDASNVFDVSPGQAEWLRRQLRERHMTDSIYHGAAIGLSLYASSPPDFHVSMLDFGRALAYLGRAGWDNENTLESQGERYTKFLVDLELIDEQRNVTDVGSQAKGDLTLPVHMSLRDLAAQLNPGGAEAAAAEGEAEWAASAGAAEEEPEPAAEEPPVAVTADEVNADEEEEESSGEYETVHGSTAQPTAPSGQPAPDPRGERPVPPADIWDTAAPDEATRAYSAISREQAAAAEAGTSAPAPSGEEPVPAAEEPVPAAEEPVPAAEEPVPAAEEPVPVAEEPVPAAEEPVPAAEEPAPAAEEPAAEEPVSVPPPGMTSGDPLAGSVAPPADPATDAELPERSAEDVGAYGEEADAPVPPADEVPPSVAEDVPAEPEAVAEVVSEPAQEDAAGVADAGPAAAAADDVASYLQDADALLPQPTAADEIPAALVEDVLAEPEPADAVVAAQPAAAAASGREPSGFLDLEAVQAGGEKQGLQLPTSVYAAAVAALASGKHLVISGPPGSGKTTLALAIARAAAKSGRADGAVLATASHGWSGRDTLGRVRHGDAGDRMLERGHVLAAASRNKWLIVDELDRARLDRAFGDLSSFLGGLPVALPDGSGEEKPPADWRILATRDTTAGPPEASPALLRRFALIHLPDLDADILGAAIGAAAGGDETAAAAVRGLLEVRELRAIGAGPFLDAARHAAERNALALASEGELAREVLAAYLTPHLSGLDPASEARLRELEDSL